MELAAVMYRRRKRCRSGDGSRVHGLTTTAIESTDDVNEEWQHHQQQTTSLFRLDRISSGTLQADNNCGIALVRNPYYMFTDPTYCMSSINGIDRGYLAFHRQVFAMVSPLTLFSSVARPFLLLLVMLYYIEPFMARLYDVLFVEGTMTLGIGAHFSLQDQDQELILYCYSSCCCCCPSPSSFYCGDLFKKA